MRIAVAPQKEQLKIITSYYAVVKTTLVVYSRSFKGYLRRMFSITLVVVQQYDSSANILSGAIQNVIARLR